MDFFTLFLDRRDLFLSTVRVSSYVPGRIRCYSDLIKNNPGNVSRIRDYFSTIKEIKSVKFNEITGSVLIEYDSAEVSRNRELRLLELELRRRRAARAGGRL